MKQVFFYTMMAALFMTAGSRLEIARREESKPALTPVSAQLYIDSTSVGSMQIELPIGIEPALSAAEMADIQSVRNRSKK